MERKSKIDSLKALVGNLEIEQKKIQEQLNGLQVISANLLAALNDLEGQGGQEVGNNDAAALIRQKDEAIAALKDENTNLAARVKALESKPARVKPPPPSILTTPTLGSSPSPSIPVEELASPREVHDVKEHSEDIALPPLLSAIKNLEVASVKLQLKQHKPQPYELVEPLITAVKEESVEIVDLLIEAKASCNHQNKDGDTPLHFAARHSNPNVSRTLLEKKASCDNSNKASKTPLHVASDRGHLKVVELLIQFSGNVNQLSEEGQSPLFYAMANGHSKVAELLLEHKAILSSNLADSEAEARPRSRALSNPLVLDKPASLPSPSSSPSHPAPHHAPSASLVPRSLSMEPEENFDYETATKIKKQLEQKPILQWADGDKKRYQTVVAIVKKHQDLVPKSCIDCRLYGGRCPAHAAKDKEVASPKKDPKDHEEEKYATAIAIIKELEQKSLLTWNETDKHRYQQSVKIYKEYQAQQKATMPLPLPYSKGKTPQKPKKTPVKASSHESALPPIVKAAKAGDVAGAKSLLAEGSIHSSQIEQALRIAASKTHHSLIELLLDNKADVNCQDKLGRSALMIAATKCYSDESLGILQLLVDRKAALSLQDQEGNTAVHSATKIVHGKGADVLLNNKASVNEVNKNVMSPLHVASDLGYVQVVEVLLLHKANINQRSEDGKTALFYAAEGGHLDCVELLLLSKASLQSDIDGRTPMQAAAVYKFQAVIEALSKASREARRKPPPRKQLSTPNKASPSPTPSPAPSPAPSTLTLPGTSPAFFSNSSSSSSSSRSP